MNFAHQHQPGSRAAGAGVVIAIHIAIVAVFASAFQHTAVQKPKPPVLVPTMPTVEPKPPVLPPVVNRPDFPSPITRLVDVPPVPDPFDPPVQVSTTGFSTSADPGPVAEATGAVVHGPGSTMASEPAITPSAVTTPGMLCATMGRPETPSVAFDGEVLIKVQGTVMNGRVVAVDVISRSGLADRRALRALTQSVDSTLRDTYQCATNGVFQQEFVFRP